MGSVTAARGVVGSERRSDAKVMLEDQLLWAVSAGRTEHGSSCCCSTVSIPTAGAAGIRPTAAGSRTRPPSEYGRREIADLLVAAGSRRQAPAE